jgi:hypothetical protein
MSDSFFTNSNFIDAQIKEFPLAICDQFIEANVRRIAAVEGPFEAAKRLQRLADICAGAHVFPIEHWRKAALKPSAVAPEPKSWFAWLKGYLTDSTVFAFWLGFFFGCFVSGGR